MNEPVVYIVSGLPRSGTSMMMKMLEAGGLPVLTDELREADADNPKGYYEFERVKALDKGDTAWVGAAAGHVVKVISALLKHLPAGFRYQVIFMQRAVPEMLRSQRKMMVRRGTDNTRVDDEEMAVLFETHLRMVEKWLANQAHFDVLYVSYNDMLVNPIEHAETVAAFLGGELNVEAMVDVVDPDLYRNRAASRNAERGVRNAE